MCACVLVIGSGGREHALAWKIAQSSDVSHVYVTPGNAGTHNNGKISNVCVSVKGDFSTLVSYCKENSIDLVVVGPEDPLAAGVADKLKNEGIACFGPSAAAAQIEASKEFAKSFMTRQNIPTARWQAFTSAAEAEKYITDATFPALVVKASGLAAGKGVIVAKDKTEACQAARDMLQDNKFGTAGSVVVVEELLEGEEISCLAFSDGTTVALFPPAQDHKRAYEGDLGPNTGGMGAYCPCPLVTQADMELIKTEVIQQAVDGMKAEGMPYVGVLYAGMMLTKDGPRTLEFNCRFGDPETQVVLPLLRSDLYDVMRRCVSGTLADCQLQFQAEDSAVAVVLVSEGYPGSYKKGYPITGIDQVTSMGHTVFHAGTANKDDQVVSSGGRVLAAVCVHSNLTTAAENAQKAAAMITFQGCQRRKDIAHKALKNKRFQNGWPEPLSYKSAGVDIGAGDALVDAIKPFAKATSRLGCSADLGGFGGIFDIKAAGYKDPLLVSGTDGVGTKLKIAQSIGCHGSVGVDLVAMCVNDILAHGAEPLFFLDYFACGKLDVGVAADVVQGVARGCQEAGCALLGGETAEMPGMYGSGEYDLAGFTVGAVEREQYLPRLSEVKPGDIVIGLPSSGVHSNGFSLVRRVIEHAGLDMSVMCPFQEGKTLGEVLLTPTRIYCKSVLAALRHTGKNMQGKVKALAHITGGGLPGNVVRILPDSVDARLDAKMWDIPAIFGWISNKGSVWAEEMAKTFNCGIGMTLIVDPVFLNDVLSILEGEGEQPRVIGKLVIHTEGSKRVSVTNLEYALKASWSVKEKHDCPSDENDVTGPKRSKVNGVVQQKKKVAVLISGSGTNLQSLIDYTQDPHKSSSAQIVLVISNKPQVQGLKRAEQAGIKTQVINHKEYSGRESFDAAVHAALEAEDIDIVCLAGFMRILTGGFVNKWKGRMLNVHPSLLPSFKGANAHKLVLEAGVRLSGCSVHFVAEEIDSGAILVQESVPVMPGDTEDSLAERVKAKEHQAFPRALEMLASGNAVLGDNGKIVWKC